MKYQYDLQRVFRIGKLPNFYVVTAISTLWIHTNIKWTCEELKKYMYIFIGPKMFQIKNKCIQIDCVKLNFTLTAPGNGRPNLNICPVWYIVQQFSGYMSLPLVSSSGLSSFYWQAVLQGTWLCQFDIAYMIFVKKYTQNKLKISLEKYCFH